MSQCQSPLVLPANLASTFRAAAYIDVRAAVQVKQLVDGYKTVDRTILATSDGIFICISTSGEMARYVAWDRIRDVHWYPALKVAAMLCPDDGFDVVVSAVEAPALLKGGGGAEVSNLTLEEAASQQRASRGGDTAPAEGNGSVASVPERALRSIAEKTTRAFQRVRSSTVNLGKRPTTAGSPTMVTELAELTMRHVGNTTEGQVHSPTDAARASPTMSSSSFAAPYGQLPVPATPPATLFEFISWASALSRSRAYHGIVASSFTVSVRPGEHLNAWQAYAVRRPDGYTMPMPFVRSVFESVHATEAQREAVVRRYHVDDRVSAQDARRAVLLGQHSVEDIGEGAALALQDASSLEDLEQIEDKQRPSSDDEEGAVGDSSGAGPSTVRPTGGTGVAGRKRGQTMFCSGGGPPGAGSCNDASFSIGGRTASAVCTATSTRNRPWSTANGGCADDDDDDNGRGDEFVVVDKPDQRNWATSPLGHLPPEAKNEWWRSHCVALVRENRELRQEADELRLRLSLLQHQATGGTVNGPSGVSGGDGSATRRHKLPF